MKNFLLVVASIIVLGFTGLILFYEYHKQPAHKANISSVVEGMGTLRSIAIDMDGSNDLSAEHILNGGDVVLVLNLKEAPPHLLQSLNVSKADAVYAFNDISSLEKFDIDKNFTIDGDDAIYPALQLIHFNAGKISKRISAFSLGVRAININPEYLLAEEKYDDSRFDKIAATVVMSDGSTRIAKIIPIDISVFNSK